MMDRDFFSDDNWLAIADKHIQHFIGGIQSQQVEPAIGNWLLAGYAQYNLMEHFRTGSQFELYVAIRLHRHLLETKEHEKNS